MEKDFKVDCIKNLYDKLTYTDKKALGWSDEYIKNIHFSDLLKRIGNNKCHIVNIGIKHQI